MAKQTVTKTEIQTEPLQKITEDVSRIVIKIEEEKDTPEEEEEEKDTAEEEEEFDMMEALKEKAMARNGRRASEMDRMISEQLKEKAVAKNDERI